MLPQTEITGAVTDLLLGVILIPLIVVALKFKTEYKKRKKWWCLLLITLDSACLMGFLAHYYLTSPIENRIIWIPLFTVMYEIFNCFFLACMSCAYGEKRPTKRDVLTVHLISLGFYIATHLIVGFFGADSIMLMTCFNTVFALVGFGMLIKKAAKEKSIGEKIILSSMLLLLPAGYYQIRRKGFIHIIWDFNHNGISHILITLGIIIVFIGILFTLKEKNKEK